MMARLVDDGKELKFIGLKDLAEHYANVRNRLNGRQKVVAALKPVDHRVVIAHFMEPMRFAFTNGVILDPDLMPPLSIFRIIRTVCRYYNIHPDILLGTGRINELVFPRHVAMYLCRELTKTSYPQIGRKFGGRDHSTVIHAIHKITEMLKDNSKLREDIHNLKSTLDDNPVVLEKKEAAQGAAP